MFTSFAIDIISHMQAPGSNYKCPKTRTIGMVTITIPLPKNSVDRTKMFHMGAYPRRSQGYVVDCPGTSSDWSLKVPGNLSVDDGPGRC